MKKKIGIVIRLAIILACICGVCCAFTDEELEIINNVENTNIVDEPTIDEETSFKTRYYDVDKKECTEETSNEASRKVNQIIGITLTFIQIFGRLGGIILIVVGICKNSGAKKRFKVYEKKLNTNEEEKKNYENDEKWKELKKKKDKAQNFLVFCIIMGITLFAFSGILHIVRGFAAKPIIYIYPEVETEVSVKLGNPEKITCSYPKYKGEWKVKASPNGDLVDLKTGRNLYSLYWEGINDNSTKMKEGFVVKGEDTAEFLEEKLEILGLNEREAEEFIIYWLPKMEKNNYNYIRFETTEEINANMPLKIMPTPDTLIRVMMEFKGLKKPINLENQKLEKVERNGYTVVEWGGTEL